MYGILLFLNLINIYLDKYLKKIYHGDWGLGDRKSVV